MTDRRPTDLPPAESAVDVVPLPSAIPPLTAVRATLIVASQRNLRGAGLLADYQRALSQAEATALREAVVGEWIDVALAVAHYRAWETLPISASAQYEFGRQLFDGVAGALLGTAGRVAKSLGSTPWLLLAQAGRFWARAYRGSAVRVRRVGAREARFELHGMPLVAYSGYRNGLRGVASAFLGMLCAQCVVTELDAAVSPTTRAFRVLWV